MGDVEGEVDRRTEIEDDFWIFDRCEEELVLQCHDAQMVAVGSVSLDLDSLGRKS